MKHMLSHGVLAALGAAALFGAGTPVAKLLLGTMSPWLVAGLLYLGAGLGLGLFELLRPRRVPGFSRADLKWLCAAIVFGGMLGPVLLMWGLTAMPASSASLLLNAEGVLTALLAWFIFRENFDRRIALGMALIVAGAVVISWPERDVPQGVWPAVAVLGACLAWAIDNNLTRRISGGDAIVIAICKGLAAGTTNLSLALLTGAHLPEHPSIWLATGLLGLVSYGVSLVLFVEALRELGTARTGAYFSTAPFAGVIVAIGFLHESVTAPLVIGGALMAAGVWLHLSERHEHSHAHEAFDHEHMHTHDLHHQHVHVEPVPAELRHSHMHRHKADTHEHQHYPDIHHRHPH